MALTVVLQDERGVALDGVDAVVLPGAAVPPSDDSAYPWAASIDPFGDTTFNRIQARLLRLEWRQLLAKAADAMVAGALEGVDQLLKRCEEGTHSYVKFIGD